MQHVDGDTAHSVTDDYSLPIQGGRENLESAAAAFGGRQHKLFRSAFRGFQRASGMICVGSPVSFPKQRFY